MSEADIDVWHRHVGHVNVQSILKLLRKEMVNGMSVSDAKEMHEGQCIPCLEGKQHCAVILTESDIKSPQMLHRPYLDICGPMETTVWKGYCYFVTFINSYSHHLIIKLIKVKSNVSNLTKEYLKRAEAETGKHTNYFCRNGGGEYESMPLQDYFKSRGIHHEMTNVYTPQENGVSE